MLIVWNLPSIEKNCGKKVEKNQNVTRMENYNIHAWFDWTLYIYPIQSWKRFDCFSWCLSEPDLFNLFIALLFLNINKLNIMIVRTLASGKITMLFRIISKLSRHQRLAVTGSKLTCQTVITWNSDRLV